MATTIDNVPRDRAAPRAPVDVEQSRLHVILIEALYLIALLAIAWFYFQAASGKSPPPASIGPLPIGVPWFGALGAVLISLTGAFEHRQDWDPSWNSWHYTRPLIGASLAIVSWVIFQAGILAVGSGAPPAQPAPTSPPPNLLYYLIAFVVGYREETFREMIKRVADVILTPKGAQSTAAAPVLSKITPATGSAAGGDPVVITGSGLTGTTSVKFGDAAASAVHVDSDTQITATTPKGSAGTVRVTVVTKNGSATSDFTYM